MARFGLWVSVLAVSFIAAVAVAEQAGPQQDPNVLCTQYSRGGDQVSMAGVFDLVMIHYQFKIRDMGTEKLREFMSYADDDRDNSLNMEECAKLIDYLNKL